MSAPITIKNLLERFSQNRSSYSASSYNETQLRREFLDPFFAALGWDVSNMQGHAEAYKEVIHEDAVKVGSATKAPDYSFRVGGTRKFFVEAKKPFVNIKDDISPAFQLRRYAWSGKLPLSILTDFEEFAVYDCRIKPNKNDKASVGRILYIRFDEYEKRWDEIAAIFSKDSILKGSFDKYAESAKGKKGTSEVDHEFLCEIERWRDLLARNIALQNPDLSQRELNFAIQRTIDRIIFLRICEDRGIEQYGTLMAFLNGENVYKRMRQNFQKADEIYNSGLFHFTDEKGRAEPPDTLTLTLQIDDKPLKDIIANLYYPESPYEFSVLPADILGQVYEQFLGKVIRLTAGHQAKVEDKPEVKKAGGVFYTPTYIVDYIVKNTVGNLIENKPPKQIENLKILDPACGSGSFLIQAYQFLLDYHRDWYIKDGVEKNSKGKEPKLTRVLSGEWRLSTAERKKILLNNIHGVDIDSQAVEVTKLSLLLKVLEGENEQSLAHQMSLWHERALPDLENNIKCGNSLIGTDYFQTQGVQEAMALYDDKESEEDKERNKINAFDWDGKDGFSEIMKNGGFDAVIGNPPYVLIGADKPKEQSYYRCNFRFNSYKINTYVLFLEKGLLLLNNTGLLGYIIPKSIVFNTYFNETRHTLLKSYSIPQIVEIREKVFVNAEVGDSLLFFVARTLTPQKNSINYYRVKNIFPEFKILNHYKYLQSTLLNEQNYNFYKTGIKIRVPTDNLDKIAIVSNGLNPGNIRHILFANKKESKFHQKLILGRDIQKFCLSWSGTWVNYDPSLRDRVKAKDIKSKAGMTPQKKVDFALRDPLIFQPDKILVRKTSDRIIAAYDSFGYYFDSLSHSIQILQKEKGSSFLLYILGLLNSRFVNYIHDGFSLNKDKVFAKVLGENLKRIPIRQIDFNKNREAKLFDQVVGFVTSILALYKKLPLAKTSQEKTILQRQIDATDRRIDELVYELYGLTAEEIKIVENSGETK